jgi:hypothetical protein
MSAPNIPKDKKIEFKILTAQTAIVALYFDFVSKVVIILFEPSSAI